MFKKQSLILIGITAFADLIFEYFYLISLKFSLESKLEQYKYFSEYVFKHHHLDHIKKNIHHAIKHLSSHFVMIAVCVLLISVCLNENLRSRIIEKSHSLMYLFPEFLGVTRFEIFLLEIECGLIRMLESKWLWNLFIDESSVLDKLWPGVVFLALTPLEIRFKIYLEKKYHYKASIIMGLIHATAGILFPIFYFAFVSSFYQCNKISSEILSEIGLDKNISLYYSKTPAKHSVIMPITYLYRHILLFCGHSTTPETNPQILFDSYKFSGFNLMFHILSPFIKNLIFAFFIIYFDKKYLKSFCNNDIHHICAHLLLEEFLDVGFAKFFYSPINLIESMLIKMHDNVIKRKCATPELLTKYFESQLHSHNCIHPSLLYSALYNQTNIISRIDSILEKY